MKIPTMVNRVSWPVARGKLPVLIALMLLAAAPAMVPDTLAGPGPGQPASRAVIRFTTALTRGTYPWRLAELLYTEAFGRLGFRFELYSVPIERALLEADAGRMDGDVARIELDEAQAAQYPHLVRVPEPVYQMKLAAYAVDPTLHVNSWADLGRRLLVVGHPRGYKATESRLHDFIDREHTIEFGSIEMGLEMLKRRRIDVLIAAQTAVESVLATEGFKKGPIALAGILETLPLYPYLHQKHRALVPGLAAAFKAMKADGTYRQLDELAKTGRDER